MLSLILSSILSSTDENRSIEEEKSVSYTLIFIYCLTVSFYVSFSRYNGNIYSSRSFAMQSKLVTHKSCILTIIVIIKIFISFLGNNSVLPIKYLSFYLLSIFFTPASIKILPDAAASLDS